MSNIVLTPQAPETTGRSPVARWIMRHSLAAFLLLTFGYSWLVGLPLLLSSWQILPFHLARLPALLIQLLAAWGPTFSALLLTGLIGGKAGVRALLDAWRPDLTLDRETIARDPVYCAEDTESGIVLGVSHFYGLNSEEVYLDHLFVEPASIGQGVGSALWRHAIEQARAAGARSIVFGADPHARSFYERMGAVVVDWRESSIVPGRRNPYLRFDLL